MLLWADGCIWIYFILFGIFLQVVFAKILWEPGCGSHNILCFGNSEWSTRERGPKPFGPQFFEGAQESYWFLNIGVDVNSCKLVCSRVVSQVIVRFFCVFESLKQKFSTLFLF
jgi:hypothetical protein